MSEEETFSVKYKLKASGETEVNDDEIILENKALSESVENNIQENEDEIEV